MRKITSLFALLLLFVLGVQAQQTVDGTHVYTISTADRGSWVVPNGETAIWSTTKANLTPLATDTKQQFAFVTVSGTQYLYSVSAKKFVSKNGNYTKLGWTGDPVSIIASSGDTDHPSVVVLNGSYQLGVSNNYDYGVISFWNDVSDAGNRVTIEAVDGVTFDDTEAQEVFSTGATTIAQTQALLDNTGVFTLQSKYGVSGSDKIYTESSDASEGNIPALLDNSYSTFHHSDWHGTAATPHWLTYELPDAADAVRFYIKQRNNGTGRPTNVTVSGSNDNNTFTEITTVSPSWDGSPLDTYSEAISASESYKYWRFTVNATNSTTNSWFCASEWYVLPNNAAVDAFFSTANTLRNPSATVSDINDAYTTAQTIETLLGSNTITYTAYNLLDNSEISSGSENVAGTFTAPAISGYAYQRATDASDNAVDLTTQTYNANTTLKLYYAPMLTDMSAVSATGVYTITTQGRGSWYDDGTQGYGGSTVGQYAFVTYAGNTYIYSTTSNKFMCHQMSSGVNQNNNRIQMQDTDLALLATGFTLAATGDITYPVSMSDANTYMFNVGGAGQLVLNTWKTLDTGNRLQIVQVANNFDATDALAALNTYFNGNYYDEVEAEVIPYLMDGQGNLSPTIGTPFGLSTSAATSIVSTYMTQLNNQQFTLEE